MRPNPQKLPILIVQFLFAPGACAATTSGLQVKGIGLQDTRENCWKFFINRVRCMLKTVLCFSPVGATLRTRSRKFPAITNCTAINWFNEWPYEALQSVSLRFLSELEALPENLRKSVSEFMSFVHASVNEMSQVRGDV